jgi:hypothetical protein
LVFNQPTSKTSAILTIAWTEFPPILLNLTFCSSSLYFARFITTGNEEGGSEQIREGAYKLDETSQNSENVEEFLTGLRFE